MTVYTLCCDDNNKIIMTDSVWGNQERKVLVTEYKTITIHLNCSYENTILLRTTLQKMNSDSHYLVVISVAKCSDRHYNLPQISLPGSDLHYSFFTV